ncbi:MAG: OmpA family protein [Prevotellaceae bacterium]|jgi:outer membrane protein OmpA-like peptidoglycan-associated protein|nr:OmpA family protein [Prevotellaceae bacterium]
MKKIQLIIVMLLLAAGLSAQQVQYILTKIETGIKGDNWGAVTTNEGEVIFCNSEGKEGENRITKLYSLRPGASRAEMLFKEESKKLFHMGAPYVSPDGQELYMAVSGEATVTMNRGVLQLAMSRRQPNGSWGPIEMFHYNLDKYNSGDPWLSNDGQYLYFASDRPGGSGGIDLWRSRKNPDGSWAPPENLKEINSEADERSPRFDNKDNFYYASNNGSMGGLDIFSCAILKDGHFTTPVRMPIPINSTADDFAITFISENSGYISSRRTGDDAIYRFERASSELIALMKVVDYEGMPIQDVQIYFMSELACDSKILTTDINGQLEAKLEPEAPYNLLVYKEEYIPKEYKNQKPKDLIDKVVTLESYPVCICEDVEAIPTSNEYMNTQVRMAGVNFDFNRWHIRYDAARELDKLVVYMKENQNDILEVSAYTDCRGSDGFNMVLSQKRANAVKDYLIRKGIAAKRIKAIGYGKTKLLNRCDCRSIDCTDIEHEVNRRAEYKIITM